ncbi:MAG: HPr family phosphocarrier protein [Lachnospiraceae bacterium]
MIKKIQVTTPGGIHVGVAALLRKTALEEQCFISIKTGSKMTSVKDYMKVLSLGIRQNDWVEIMIESDHDEEIIMSRIEKILSFGRRDK